MMRTLLAIDEEREFHDQRTPAEELLLRLRFAALNGVEAVHVLPMPAYVGYDVGAYMSADLIAQARDAERERVAALVREVAERCSRSGLIPCSCTTALLEGNAADRLLERTEETHADLIAINGSRHGEAAAMLLGSVARDLLVCAPCSLLIAKRHPGEKVTLSAPLRVVLATDHSEYTNRCIERLLDFCPRGIGELTVVCAYPGERLRALGKHVARPCVDLGEAVHSTLDKKNEALIERLRSDGLGSEVCYRSLVVAGHAHEVITKAMRDAEADLLILGARGHGLVERLMVGSVSYREAAASPHSVLVLRV
jgi:nucleotide-binding universal stress UspA family protein